MTILKHSWPHKLRLPQDVKPQLIFADPMYNIGADYEDDPTRDKLSHNQYVSFCRATIETLMEMLPPGGMLWWLCWAKDGRWMWDIVHDHGALLHGVPIIWYERFSQYQSKRLTLDYRLLFPIVKPGAAPVFNPDDCRIKSARQEEYGDKRANKNGRVPGHVWTVRRLQGTANDRVDWHPVQLPPEPLELMLGGFTNPGDVVLDAFAGSGNMGVACQKMGRKFVGVDQSRLYCTKMRERLTGALSFTCVGCNTALPVVDISRKTGMGAYCAICEETYGD